MSTLMYSNKAIDYQEAPNKDAGNQMRTACPNAEHCEELQKQCVETLRNLMERSDMYTGNDFALEQRGLLQFAQQQEVEELKRSLHVFIPDTITRVTRAEQQFYAQLAQARTRGWITEGTAHAWQQKLKSKGTPWWKKEQFLQQTFPHLLDNWQHLSNDIERVKKLGDQNETYAQIPQVHKVLKGSAMKKYKEWRSAVDEALAAIGAHEKGDSNQILYQKTKGVLENAVKEGVLSEHKVGTWLQRIFRSRASLKEINAFVNGKESTSLIGLIKNWTKVKKRFDVIELRRKKEGTPRGFHFVTTNSFLNWHFSKRLAYVTEAEQRFADIAKEKPILLEIRRELDSQDWESAEHLLQQAKQSSMTEEDRKKIASMENYLKEHRTQTGEKQKKQKNPEQAAEENEQIISLLPASLQQLYLNAVREGKFPCLAALMYNRVWCHERGQVLNASKEKKLQKTATEDTRRRLQQENDGKRQLANTDVNAFREPSIRSYAYTGINAPQILHVGPSGHGALLAKINTEDTYLFRYWTTLIPTDVDYATHAYIVKHLHPLMKGNLRAIAAGNATVPKPEKRPSSSGH